MGNRAVITTEEKQIGVYLHWNGGKDSVQAFLKACKRLGYRTPESDSYGWAYLCKVIANYFNNGLHVGIDLYKNLDQDNGDNGVFIIKDWKIIGREFFTGKEQEEYELESMVKDIMDKQPK